MSDKYHKEQNARLQASDSAMAITNKLTKIYNLRFLADRDWAEWEVIAKPRRDEINYLRREITRLETRLIKQAEVVEIARNLTLERDEGGRGYYAVQGCGKDAELLAEALKNLDEKAGS